MKLHNENSKISHIIEKLFKNVSTIEKFENYNKNDNQNIDDLPEYEEVKLYVNKGETF